jgi:hypothetical protein
LLKGALKRGALKRGALKRGALKRGALQGRHWSCDDRRRWGIHRA